MPPRRVSACRRDIVLLDTDATHFFICARLGDDLILGWDWISSHEVLLLYVDGRVSLRSGPAQLQMDLLRARARLAPRTLSVICHGEFRRLLRQIERVGPEPAVAAPAPPPAQAPPRRSTGWSCLTSLVMVARMVVRTVTSQWPGLGRVLNQQLAIRVRLDR